MTDAVTQQARSLLMDDIADDLVLNSSYEIENALSILNHLDSKIQWFKYLKRARNKELDREVRILEDRQQRLRAVILRTMRELEPNRKTLDFPSVGKVSRRQTPDSWIIEDEDQFMSWASARGYAKQITQVTTRINMREAKKIIAEASKTETIPGVAKNPGSESISVSLSDAKTIKADKADKTTTQLSLDDLDSLTESDL